MNIMLPQPKRAAIFLAICTAIYLVFPGVRRRSSAWNYGDQTTTSGESASERPFHLLIPATQSDPNLCKTVLTASILDYPPPIIMAWDQTVNPDEQEGMLGGGTHLLKISKVSEWLENLPEERDNDLVMMMDGYDIWFQLPRQLLLERYDRIIKAANRRIRKRMGRAAAIEGIEETIVFAAGKRCYPNEIHTMACWPLPPSPLYEDMWGDATDSTVGSYPNIWTSTRQRFLNSGVIIGPAKDMRRLFAQAAAKVNELGKDPEPDDNGSGSSGKVYLHSDQSIFNMIFGEQEYQREVMRIRHMSWIWNPVSKMQQLFGKDLSDTDLTLEGNPIKNILHPPWARPNLPQLPGKPLEFSIGLDYWNLLAYQTANSERNGGWLTWSAGPIEGQAKHKDRWDCKPHLPYNLPSDIRRQPAPFSNLAGSTVPPQGGELAPELRTTPWEDVPLYTNICAGTIPAMVHLNGDKNLLKSKWKEMWFQPHVEELAKSMQAREAVSLLKGAKDEGRKVLQPGNAFADTGKILDFSNDLCKDWDFS